MAEETDVIKAPTTEDVESVSETAFSDIEEFSNAELEDLFNKNTESFQCLAQILISRSSLLRHPLYHFPPLVDPGLDEAFNYTDPEPVIDDAGREQYKTLCKKFEIVEISRVLKFLSADVLDLTYYGLSNKAIRAIMGALSKNKYVKTLVLEENLLTPESCKEICDMLIVNTKIENLQLKECRIKPEGAEALSDGIYNTQYLKELELSFNSLGNEGLELLEDALCVNSTIKRLNLSHNDLDEEAAKTLGRILDVNFFIEDLDLSWNGFYTGPGNKALFSALEVNNTIKCLNLAWNGIETKEAARPIMKYLKGTESLLHFDISNNRLTQQSFKQIKNGVSKCLTLVSLRIGNNLLTPDEGFAVAKLVTVLKNLQYVDLENTFLNKDFVPFWKKQTKLGKSILIGGILSNYTIKGPDTVKLVFNRANFLAKKSKKNFGLKHPEKSNYAKHILEQNHPITPQNNIKFLHFCNNKHKLDILEAFEIYRHKHTIPLMNEQTELSNSPLLEVLDI